MERPRIRYQFDEHVAHAIAHGLVRQGIDVARANEAGTVGLPDDQLLARCLVEGRVVVTQDRDFMRLHHQGLPHAGIVYWKHGRRSIGDMAAFLVFLAEALTPDDMAGRVEYA